MGPLHGRLGRGGRMGSAFEIYTSIGFRSCPVSSFCPMNIRQFRWSLVAADTPGVEETTGTQRHVFSVRCTKRIG